MPLYPSKNQRVCDTLSDRTKERWGTVVGSYHARDTTLFIKVKFDDQQNWQEPEELEYEGFFTQDNCGNGRWDVATNSWRIEPTGDELPADHPDVLRMNKMFENMNKTILRGRYGDTCDEPVSALKERIAGFEAEAASLGERHPYYAHYKNIAEDHQRIIDLQPIPQS